MKAKTLFFQFCTCVKKAMQAIGILKAPENNTPLPLPHAEAKTLMFSGESLFDSSWRNHQHAHGEAPVHEQEGGFSSGDFASAILLSFCCRCHLFVDLFVVVVAVLLSVLLSNVNFCCQSHHFVDLFVAVVAVLLS